MRKYKYDEIIPQSTSSQSLYIQSIIDYFAVVIIPDGDYYINDSIKIKQKNKKVNIKATTKITVTDDYIDSDEKGLRSKQRNSVFWCYKDGCYFDFNGAEINCNQSHLENSDRYMNVIVSYSNLKNITYKNITGYNAHNTVYNYGTVKDSENYSYNIAAYNIILDNRNQGITNDGFKNASFQPIGTIKIEGNYFRGYDCEEVVDVSPDCSDVILSDLYGDICTQNVLEINNSKNVWIDQISGINLTDDELVYIQNYEVDPPFQYINHDIKLTNMKNNSDFYDPDDVSNQFFYI
jgi:hypothetical protein